MTLIFCCIFFAIQAGGSEVLPPSVDNLLKQSTDLDWTDSTSESVLINAPLSEVWTYASDSSQAKNWSVYFDHISTLPNEAHDGSVGSIRRCFRNADETGPRWDELTIAVQPESQRQLYVYNLVGFQMNFIFYDTRYFVIQLYEKIDDSHTRLTFKTVPEKRLISKVAAIIGKKTTDHIFTLNLENIKTAIEQKAAYARLHPWDPNY